ncbi:MAG: hypothetical protein JXL97_13690 [Bacteroidales bacterium]|nr:hypothetical protein [Bacteroidales bacterium]
MAGGFFSNKVNSAFKKAQLKSLLKKIDFQVDVDDFFRIIEENNYTELLDIKTDKVDLKTIKSLVEAYYYLAIKQYDKSFSSSFFLIEFLVRNEYSKTSIDASKMRFSELIKWAKNRNVFTSQQYYFLMAFKETRNKLVHELVSCSPEEAKIILTLAFNIFKKIG